jgi:ABC-type glycerol-3-phosphate transport system permease component
MSLRVAVFVIAAFIFNFPYIATVVTSLKTDAEISANPSLTVLHPTLANYRRIAEIGDRFDIVGYLFNSLVAASLGSLLAALLAILLRIVAPLTVRTIASSLILAFIYSWNEFLFGLMLTTQRAVPVTVGASFFFSASGGGVRWGVAAAVMVVSTLPPLVISLAAYRYIGQSLTAGAVKG